MIFEEISMKKLESKAIEFSKMNAFFSVWCSQLVYEDWEIVRSSLRENNYEPIEMFDMRDTQAFIASNEDSMIVSFRGTSTLKDAMTDINIDLVDGVGGQVHEGFMIALNYIWKDLYKTIVANRGKRSLWLTGHSLGAGLACLATAKLMQEKDEPVNGLYTFGMPRTGDRRFAKNFNASFGDKTFRFVNNNDIVTRTPFRSMGYSHVGQFKYFDEHGTMRNDLNWWEKLLDRIHGRIDDLFEPGTDGIKDHAIDEYVDRVARLIR